jgi:hypothetical protein
MASGSTLVVFTPNGAEFPASDYATLDTRNNHPCLDFDTTTAETAYWTAVMPQSYSDTTGVTVYVHWAATSATSGTIGWLIAFERDADGSSVTSDDFASNQTITAATVPGTAGILDVTSVAITKGANMDSVVAGDMFRLQIQRDVSNDTASGDAEVYAVEIRET